MAAVASEAEILRQANVPSRGWTYPIVRMAKRNPVGFVAGIVCILLILLAIFGPFLSPHLAEKTGFARLHAPSRTYPLGTDNLTRDMFSRIITGARVTMGIGFLSISISTALSVLLGVMGGYLGGWADMAVSRVLDVMMAYPPLVFSIFFLSIFHPTYLTVAIAIGITLTPGATRIVRGATIGVRHQPYIESARALGSSQLRIMAQHVFPNVTAPIIVIVSIQIGIALLAEAGLSFLGLGVSSAAYPSWGKMLQDMRPVWQLAWWTAVIPGLAISVAVLAFNLFGDALRDVLDPRLRGSR